MVAFDPSIPGIFIFGLIAGICPCNSVLCLGLIGYLTGSDTRRSLIDTLRLTVPFALGTILTLLPLGVLAGLIGRYLLFINEAMAWSFGGIILVLMGLQLLKLYKPPIRSIYNLFKGMIPLKGPGYDTAFGTFLIGLSFGAITIGRAAPMLMVVLTYIALYQTPVSGFITMLIYALGLSIPLLLISSIGGTAGSAIRHATSASGEFFDKVIGVLLILTGIYFFILALS